MYTKQEASLIRKKFWTSFGLYMRPVTGAEGNKINWLNYKTGIKHVFFRMNAEKNVTSIAIEYRHPDLSVQQKQIDQLLQLESLFLEEMGEEWEWGVMQEDEQGVVVSRVVKNLEGVNIFNEADWPAIISFLKPRMIALDNFWSMVKEGFE